MTLDEYLTRREDADKKFTARKFALEAGVSVSQISRLRRGLCRPTPDTIVLLHEKTKGKVTPKDWLVEVAR